MVAFSVVSCFSFDSQAGVFHGTREKGGSGLHVHLKPSLVFEKIFYSWKIRERDKHDFHQMN